MMEQAGICMDAIGASLISSANRGSGGGGAEENEEEDIYRAMGPAKATSSVVPAHRLGERSAGL
jgi:hypothetical protein